jgi:hypothetical protein
MAQIKVYGIPSIATLTHHIMDIHSLVNYYDSH